MTIEEKAQEMYPELPVKEAVRTFKAEWTRKSEGQQMDYEDRTLRSA